MTSGSMCWVWSTETVNVYEMHKLVVNKVCFSKSYHYSTTGCELPLHHTGPSGFADLKIDFFPCFLK